MQPGPTSPPICVPQRIRERSFVVGQILLEILAVPTVFYDLLLSFEKDGVESSGGCRVANPLGPLLACTQRRQIIARDERGDAVQFLIVVLCWPSSSVPSGVAPEVAASRLIRDSTARFTCGQYFLKKESWDDSGPRDRP